MEHIFNKTREQLHNTSKMYLHEKYFFCMLHQNHAKTSLLKNMCRIFNTWVQHTAAHT